MSIKEFKNRFTKIEEEVEEIDINEIEEKVYELEEEISREIGLGMPNENTSLKKLLKKIAEFKKENEFYNESDELDRMFTNRNDDDFDEDSMSYDSVFGKD